MRLRTEGNECLGLYRYVEPEIKEERHVHVMGKGEVKEKIIEGMI